jgi:hypothetical protein
MRISAANDDGVPQSAKPRPPRPKATRNIGALPKHLPRCEVVIEPESKVCPCCGGALHVIGEDVSEQLDVIPAVIQVKRIRRPRYGCRSCEGTVVQAKPPPRLVENGMATTALVASIVIRLALAPEPADRYAAGPRRQPRSVDPGPLGITGSLVAETTLSATRGYRAVLTKGILR